MYQYIFIIGKNPSLSLAEIKARLADPLLSILTENTVLLKLNQEITNPQQLLDTMGGTIKITNYECHTTNENINAEIFQLLNTNFLQKRHIGISYYTQNKKRPPNIFQLKKDLKKAGINKRFIFDREKLILNAGTIKKNKLLSKGMELVIIPTLHGTYFSQTLAVQNVDRYTKRDYGKPKPDPHAGMLPPKLAQIMISLAQLKNNDTIYDPFCGSGTILQEALLQNYQIIGSDISEKAIVHTRENLKWLIKNFQLNFPDYRHLIEKNIFTADASHYRLPHPVEAIVTEPFLGPAMRQLPSPVQARQYLENLLPLYSQFLNISVNNVNPTGKIVMVLPRFQTTDQEIPFPLSRLLDQKLLSYYNQIRFDDNELIYSQPGQKVHRQILILQKKN
ncbi:MAG: DNA methyltransferase [Patescibacteria group bacterium]